MQNSVKNKIESNIVKIENTRICQTKVVNPPTTRCNFGKVYTCLSQNMQTIKKKSNMNVYSSLFIIGFATLFIQVYQD